MARGPSAKRYAEAIFELALEEQNLDGWADDLTSIARQLENQELVALLDAPHVPVTEKQKVLDEVFSGTAKARPINLLSLLASRNSIRLLPMVLNEFERMVHAHKGVVLGEIVSAIRLDKTELEAIGNQLKDLIGSEVKLETKVDPGILGGFIAKVGDQILDGSTKTKLDQMRYSLIGRTG